MSPAKCINIQGARKVPDGGRVGVVGGAFESAFYAGGVFISRAVPGAEI